MNHVYDVIKMLAYCNKKAHGLKAQSLKTSLLAAVQVLAFKVGENDISHFLSIFSKLLMAKV